MKLFDIIVPTYKRFETLPRFFDKLMVLPNDQYTLWLVDDHSPNPNIQIVPEAPHVQYIRLDQNTGQAGARNYAIALGKAPYVISLDDDAWFEPNHDILETIQKAFDQYPDTGCLMFNIKTPNSDYLETVNGKELAIHVTCGCVYRRSALNDIQGFSSILKGMGEETDLSLKLLKKEWKIRSLYSIKVYHDFDPDQRSLDWYLKIRYMNTRNDLAIVYMHYPLAKLFLYLPGKAFNHLKYAVTKGIVPIRTLAITLKGCVDFLFLINKLERNPMSLHDFNYWKGLRTNKL